MANYLSKFNYVIAHVQIGDEVYLLDATEKNKPWHLLPERVVNGSGRLISSSIAKTGWVNLENTPLTTINETTTIMVKSNGAWDAIVMQHLDNYAAFDLLNTAKEYDTDEELIAAIEAKSPESLFLNSPSTSRMTLHSLCKNAYVCRVGLMTIPRKS